MLLFKGYRSERIVAWRNPEASEKGYQTMQALYAIGSGGWFGKGLGQSIQKRGFIPEAQNDMIFSIICEELGILGAMIVVLLFVFLLWRLFFIATNAPDLLGSLIATGIFAHISLQVVLNIAVVLNVIPTTGITLPFVSYGGTSILFLMTEMMLALSISGQIRMRK
jgi:cell division protein FtsW